MLAAEQGGGGIAGPVLVVLVVVGGVISAFGYARAVMDRANSDYKKTKEGLPGMRKAYWAAWRQAFKFGFWVLLAAVILIFWAVRDMRT